MQIFETIKNELQKYFFESVETSGKQLYSEWNLKLRLHNFKTRTYPTGKITEEGEYEYWFDRIQPIVNDWVKNLRLDSKYFLYWSNNPVKDFAPVFILNNVLTKYMEDTRKAEELFEATEEFCADGNILFRKTNQGYEKCDMMNTFLINTLAKTVDDTAIIERFYLSQSELRQNIGLYNETAVNNVIKNVVNRTYTPNPNIIGGSEKKAPLYELYRRTGEISEKELFEAQGRSGGDPNKFVLARVVVAGLTKGGNKNEYVLFAEELSGKMSDYYKEAHAGMYKGRWWREGLYEQLMDLQIAYNELSIEIMRAIPWNSSAIFRSTDLKIQNSLRSSLTRGDIIHSGDLQQIQVSSRINEAIIARNDILRDMQAIGNSFEVVSGVTPASGTPLGTTQLMNQNANKFFDFLRKKLAVPYRYIYEDDVLPQLIKKMNGTEILKITGSPQVLEDFRRIAANNWFNQNLALIGPHTPEMREELINIKIQELQKKDIVLKNTREIWNEIEPRIFCTVVGENFNTNEIDTILQVIPLEQDPIRRSEMLDFVLRSKGLPEFSRQSQNIRRPSNQLEIPEEEQMLQPAL